MIATSAVTGIATGPAADRDRATTGAPSTARAERSPAATVTSRRTAAGARPSVRSPASTGLAAEAAEAAGVPADRVQDPRTGCSSFRGSPVPQTHSCVLSSWFRLLFQIVAIPAEGTTSVLQTKKPALFRAGKKQTATPNRPRGRITRVDKSAAPNGRAFSSSVRISKERISRSPDFGS